MDIQNLSPLDVVMRIDTTSPLQVYIWENSQHAFSPASVSLGAAEALISWPIENGGELDPHFLAVRTTLTAELFSSSAALTGIPIHSFVVPGVPIDWATNGRELLLAFAGSNIATLVTETSSGVQVASVSLPSSPASLYSAEGGFGATLDDGSSVSITDGQVTNSAPSLETGFECLPQECCPDITIDELDQAQPAEAVSTPAGEWVFYAPSYEYTLEVCNPSDCECDRTIGWVQQVVSASHFSSSPPDCIHHTSISPSGVVWDVGLPQYSGPYYRGELPLCEDECDPGGNDPTRLKNNDVIFDRPHAVRSGETLYARLSDQFIAYFLVSEGAEHCARKKLPVMIEVEFIAVPDLAFPPGPGVPELGGGAISAPVFIVVDSSRIGPGVTMCEVLDRPAGPTSYQASQEQNTCP